MEDVLLYKNVKIALVSCEAEFLFPHVLAVGVNFDIKYGRIIFAM